MINRPLYMDRLQAAAQKPSIKILTGIRRGGKSSFLQLLRDELTESGVPKQNIITYSFEGLENPGITNYSGLYDNIAKRAASATGRIYLFLDEPQRIYSWERAVLHLFHDLDVDIYVSGSNNAVVSQSVLAILDERYEIINIGTLSFREYLDFRENYTEPESQAREFARYIMLGGFPALHLRNHSQDAAYSYLRDILSSAIWNDVVGTNQLRKAEQLNRIIKFVFENIGKAFSAKYLSDSLKKENKEINIETVYTYLERLENAYIVSRCRRYDLSAEEPLKTQEKFYPSDPAFRFALLGFAPEGVGPCLENIVYLELINRGYDVYLGKHGRREVDFVAMSGDERLYIQMGREIHPQRAENHSFSVLSSLRDNYPKFILCMDKDSVSNKSGIQTVTITDFLSGEVGI